MRNPYLTFSAISGFFCVAFGAFTAHALEHQLTEQALIWIDKGLKYQMFHTLALLCLALGQFAKIPSKMTACQTQYYRITAICWILGIVLFSGSLYALALGANKVLVWITPIGGILFLVGWVSLIYLTIRGSHNE